MSRIKKLVGMKFGRLLVVTDSGKRASGVVLWNCICDCGNETVVRSNSLNNGNTQSCGCLKIETTKELGSRVTHNLSYTPEYQIWRQLIERCTKPNNQAYDNYGARGITVCERWLSSVENFYADMGPRPSPDHSLDRKDNDGNYEPNNCRWATRVEQCNNRRSNRIVSYKGIEYTVVQLTKEYSINPLTFISRLNLGWSVENAIETPVKIYRNTI